MLLSYSLLVYYAFFFDNSARDTGRYLSEITALVCFVP